MSLPTEVLLLQVDVQANNARLVELQKALNDSKAATAALNLAFKEGRITADEYAAGQVRLKQSAADVSQEMKVLTAANAAQKKSSEAAAGSINQLRAELSKGTAAYNALSQAERDNTVEGQRLQASNKALSDQLKVLEKAVGDTRRNVGNYKDDVVGALRETNLFGVNIGQTADNLKGNLQTGLNIAKAGFGSLKAAIAATGIGLLVVVLGSLFEYFKKTDEGAEDLAAGMAGLKAGAEVLQGYVIDLGKSLYDAFTNPLGAIKSIGKFLLDVVSNPKKAFNDFIDGIESGFTRVKTRVVEAGNAAVVLSRANDALDDRERAAIELTVKQRNEVERLISTVRDRNLTEQQRIKNLQEAGRIENAILNRTISIEQERLRILQQQEALEIRNGKRSDEADKKIQEQKGRLAELAGQSATLQQTIKNRISAQQEADRVQRAQEAANAAEKLRKQQEVAQKQLEADRQRLAARATEAQREYTESLQLLENYLNTKRAALERDYAAGVISENEYQKQLNAVEKAGIDAQRVINGDYRKDNAEADKRAADLEIKEQGRVKNEKKKLIAAEQTIRESAIEAGLAASDALIAALGEETEAGQAAVAIKKTLALAEIGINLQKQLSLNKVAAAELNALLPGSGIAYEIATDALAIAAAAASAAKVLSFQKGGFVSGPGTGTSDSIPARLSNGESVMNANTTAMFAPLLSHLNVLGGGVAFPGFAAGGLVGQRGGVPDGGFVGRAMSGQLMVVDPAQFVAALERANLDVSVRAIDRAKGRFNKPRLNSTLGS